MAPGRLNPSARQSIETWPIGSAKTGKLVPQLPATGLWLFLRPGCIHHDWQEQGRRCGCPLGTSAPGHAVPTRSPPSKKGRDRRQVNVWSLRATNSSNFPGKKKGRTFARPPAGPTNAAALVAFGRRPFNVPIGCVPNARGSLRVKENEIEPRHVQANDRRRPFKRKRPNRLVAGSIGMFPNCDVSHREPSPRDWGHPPRRLPPYRLRPPRPTGLVRRFCLGDNCNAGEHCMEVISHGNSRLSGTVLHLCRGARPIDHLPRSCLAPAAGTP